MFFKRKGQEESKPNLFRWLSSVLYFTTIHAERAQFSISCVLFQKNFVFSPQNFQFPKIYRVENVIYSYT